MLLVKPYNDATFHRSNREKFDFGFSARIDKRKLVSAFYIDWILETAVTMFASDVLYKNIRLWFIHAFEYAY